MPGVNNKFQQAGATRDNPLDLTSGSWFIDGEAVTASADQLNNAGALDPVETSLPMTWGSAFDTPVSAAIKYSLIGGQVTLLLPVIAGTTTAMSLPIVSQTALPVALRPSADLSVPVFVDNDGSGDFFIARAKISSAGIITIYKDVIGGGFPATTALTTHLTPASYITL